MADKHDKSEEAEDFAPINTPGYKPGAGKSVDEYRNLDANDDSLARWKESLGLGAAGGGDTSGPKLTILCLELTSPTLPEGKSIKIDFTAQDQRNKIIQVKEGAPYKAIITYRVNHSIVTGVRYIQVTKGKVVKDKVESMLGSYSADPTPRVTEVISDEFPSGMIARGTYNVKSKVIDLDGHEWLDYPWQLKIAKDW